ncbi:MAG: CDP-alcohol phosphatidyltransferase family protein [bacterium]|nr:CDP-alcohol phosphatidyltransferase family protein [bacterium]
MSPSTADSATQMRAILVRREETDDPAPRIWGLDTLERLARGAQRLGAVSCVVLDRDQPPATDTGQGNFLVLRSDLVYDERLLAGLLESPNIALADKLPGQDAAETLAAHVDAANLPAAISALRGLEPQQAGAIGPNGAAMEPAFRIAEPVDLAPAYDPKLRKPLPPFVFSANSDNASQIENAIFRASYKGITDLVTKWVWPLPARGVTRILAARGVRPNSVTAVGYVLTALATWFFFEGWFGAGLVAGWIMTFLDTVDGKLARCTLTSSKLGDVLDHGLDLIHPPIWWAAWAWGLSAGFAGYETATAIVVGGYVTGRLLEGVFLLFFEQELFTWQRFDALFRTVIARRNPNLILLSVGTLLGRPDAGFLAVAFWTLVANIVPLVRIVQAFVQRSRGVEIRSWHEAATPTPAEKAPSGKTA